MKAKPPSRIDGVRKQTARWNDRLSEISIDDLPSVTCGNLERAVLFDRPRQHSSILLITALLITATWIPSLLPALVHHPYGGRGRQRHRVKEPPQRRE